MRHNASFINKPCTVVRTHTHTVSYKHTSTYAYRCTVMFRSIISVYNCGRSRASGFFVAQRFQWNNVGVLIFPKSNVERSDEIHCSKRTQKLVSCVPLHFSWLFIIDFFQFRFKFVLCFRSNTAFWLCLFLDYFCIQVTAGRAKFF